MTGHRLRGWGIVAVAAAAATLASIVVLAIDVTVVEGAAPARQTVAVTADRGIEPEFAGFSPGHAETWRLDATPGSSAKLELRVDAAGPLTAVDGGLALSVATCRDSWTASSSCARKTTVLARTPLSDPVFADGIVLGRVAAGTTVHVQLVFQMPDTAAARTDDSLMGLSGSADLRVTASGITLSGSGSGSGSGAGGASGGGQGSGSSSGSGSGSGSGPSSGSGAGSSGAGGSDGSGRAGGPFDQTDPGTRGSDLRDRTLAWTGTTIAGVGVLGGAMVGVGTVVILARRRRASS